LQYSIAHENVSNIFWFYKANLITNATNIIIAQKSISNTEVPT